MGGVGAMTCPARTVSMRNTRTQWRVVGGKHALEHHAHPARWVAPVANLVALEPVVERVRIPTPVVPPSRLARLDTFLTTHPNVQRAGAIGAGLALGGVMQLVLNLIGG